MPSTLIQSDSSTKSDQEIVNSHESDTQNRLFDQDDLETFVLLFLIIYMLSLQQAITWCWETLQNFVRFVYNNYHLSKCYYLQISLNFLYFIFLFSLLPFRSMNIYLLILEVKCTIYN